MLLATEAQIVCIFPLVLYIPPSPHSAVARECAYFEELHKT